MDKKINKTTVDGRRAEVHSFEQPINNGTQRITEHFEEIIPFEKKMRVVEDVVPVVTQRVVEKIVDGQVVKTVEMLDQSQLVPSQPKSTLTSLDVESIEGIIRRIINDSNVQEVPQEVPSLTKPSFFSWFKASDTPSVDYVGYILVTLLAVGVAVISWQLFIR
jgi:hypothetical protein